MAQKDSRRQVGMVALLRGINLASHNLLPMKDLACIFADTGCRDVRTYIRSGNVIFRPGPGALAELSEGVTRLIAERFGHRVPVILRTASELRETALNNPFLATGADPSNLHVYFLADRPLPEQVAALDPERSAPDAFALRNRDLYVHLPNGMARTKLTNVYFDKKLGTVSTARTWRTVLKLVEMVCALPAVTRQ